MTTIDYRRLPVPLRLRVRIAAVLALASTSIMLVAVTGARASEWAQVSCSLAGKPVSTEGWTPSWRIESSANEIFTNECAKGGDLEATDDQWTGELQEAGAGAVWAYAAPTGSTIIGGTVAYSMIAPYGISWISTPESESDSFVSCVYDPHFPGNCGEVGTSGAAAIPDEGGTRLYLVALCQGHETTPTCMPGLDARVKLASAEIVLNANATPSASGFTGSLLEGSAGGNATMSFTAHDLTGPGVYGVTVKIDGEPVYSRTPDSNHGECAIVGADENNIREFQYMQPCPQSVPVTIEVPTGRYPNGEHQLAVEVEDATGRVASVYGGPITIDNHPPSVAPSPSIIAAAPPERGRCNGTPCDETAKLLGASNHPGTWTQTYGRSASTLTGRLVDHTDAPVTDAQVQLLEQPNASGASLKRIATATTAPSGAWSFKVPKGASRLLRVAYFSHLLDATPAATLDRHERVTADVVLTAPRRVRLGHAFAFRGSLAGGYNSYPEDVEMQIYYLGRWRTVDVVSTNSRGQFAYRYTFAVAGSSYAFRAVALASPAFPFLSSASRPARIRVGG